MINKINKDESGMLQLLTPLEAAQALGISAGTLAVWRCLERYPLRYIKVGYRVRYRLKDLEAFLEARARKRSKQNSGKNFRKAICTSYYELLRNPFYSGFFVWDSGKYRGTHSLFIDAAVFQRTQEVLNNFNRPRQQKHEFAFSGLLTCAFDECAVTAEIKKGKYTYYHCTGYRGKCDLAYMREEALGERLGQILKNIQIPDDILRQLSE